MLKRNVLLAAAASLALIGAACFVVTTSASRSASNEGGIHKIRHIVIIMQENRSFDHYFGTFPGADGIPMKNGVPTVCVPQPSGSCVRPYRDTLDRNRGGPHNFGAAKNDINGGKMDGFLDVDARRPKVPGRRRSQLRETRRKRRRDGVPRRNRHSKLLEVCER